MNQSIFSLMKILSHGYKKIPSLRKKSEAYKESPPLKLSAVSPKRNHFVSFLLPFHGALSLFFYFSPPKENNLVSFPFNFLLFFCIPSPTRMLLSPSSIYFLPSKTNPNLIFLPHFYSLRLTFLHMHVGCVLL